MHVNRHVQHRSVGMSGLSGLFTSAKHKAAKEDEENASSPREPTDLDQLTEDAWDMLVKAEKQLEETAKTVVEELGRVLVLIQVELPFDQNLKFPDFGGVAKHLENLANELKAHAMEELKQLAENLKDAGWRRRPKIDEGRKRGRRRGLAG